MRVAVVMPAYNAADYLAESIESVQQQSHTDWQLWIVDDASTDATPDVIKPFLNDERIRYERVTKIGSPSGVRNHALQQIQNDESIDAVTFLDSDDVFFLDTLERMTNALKENPDWHSVQGEPFFCNQRMEPLNTYLPLKQTPEGTWSFIDADPTQTIEKVLQGNITCLFSTVMMRRRTLQTVGLLDENLLTGEDFQYFCRLMLHGEKGLGRIPHYTYKYREYNTSITRDEARLMRALDSHEALMDWLFSQPRVANRSDASELKQQAIARNYRFMAKERLKTGSLASTRRVTSRALQDPLIPKPLWLKQLGSIHLMSFCPPALNEGLIRARLALKTKNPRVLLAPSQLH